MKEIDFLVLLDTNDPDKELVLRTRYVVQGHLTCSIRARSGAFAGESSFCLSHSEASVFIHHLSQLHERLDGGARLCDKDSDAHLEFVAAENGHILVIGQIGGSHEAQFLKFSFETDQTALVSFLQSFRELILESDG